MVVSQVRPLSIRAAQIFAAAAASVRGPAARRSCMPSPVALSFTMMIGRNPASSESDLVSPRQSARKPPIELAVPTSTANSVRCTAAWAAASSDASGSFGVTDATTVDAGGSPAWASAGLSGSISFNAPGSGGARIDLAPMSGVAGVGCVAAGAFEAAGVAGGAGAGFCSFAAASVRGLSALGAGSDLANTVVAGGATVVVAGATVVVTGATVVAARPTVVAAGATVVVTGATAGAAA